MFVGKVTMLIVTLFVVQDFFLSMVFVKTHAPVYSTQKQPLRYVRSAMLVANPIVLAQQTDNVTIVLKTT